MLASHAKSAQKFVQKSQKSCDRKSLQNTQQGRRIITVTMSYRNSEQIQSQEVPSPGFKISAEDLELMGLESWPQQRMSSHNVRMVAPTAAVKRGPGPIQTFPREEKDLGSLQFSGQILHPTQYTPSIEALFVFDKSTEPILENYQTISKRKDDRPCEWLYCF